MYKVRTKEFDTFDEVISWAWSELKVSFEGEGNLSEEQRRDACEQLALICTDLEVQHEKDTHTIFDDDCPF
jgi:hypothetical protein